MDKKGGVWLNVLLSYNFYIIIFYTNPKKKSSLQYKGKTLFL